MSMEYLAKSSGETLKEHSIKLMFRCYNIMKNNNVDEKKDGRDIIRCAIIASLFHDIGKTSFRFQNYLNDYINGIETNTPGHSIVGGYLFNTIVSDSSFDRKYKKDIIKDIIMFHMTEPLYNNRYLYDYYSVDDINSVIEYIKDIIDTFENKFDEVEGYRLNLNISFNKIDEDDLDIKLPSEISRFPHSTILEENRPRCIEEKIYIEGIFDMLFDVVRWYDMQISSGEKLFDVNRHKRYDISVEKPASYDMDRWLKQVKYAKQIADSNDKNVFTIKADTGFGKTMIAILTTIFSGGYSYFVLPTNQLSKSIYENIKKGLKDLGLENVMSVSLLLSGEWVDGQEKEKSNIIVTNIDNFEIGTFRNSRKKISIQHLNRTCIFDEFHTYICSAPLMFSFASTIKERLMCKNIKTVLMSATPVYDKCFINMNDVEIIEINDENFANRRIRFTFDNSKEDIINKYYGGTLIDKDVLSIACTIPSADSIHESVNNMIHSRFTESDKKKKMNDLLKYKGKENRTNYSISSTSNMIGQGVDCSFNAGTIIENETPESTIQAMGRNLRYTYDGIRKCHVCLDPSKTFRFTQTEWKRIDAWNNLLKFAVGDDVIITTRELEDLRNKFNETKESFTKEYIRESIVESYNQYIQIEFKEGYDIKSGDDEAAPIRTSDGMSLRGETDNIYCLFMDVDRNLINEPILMSSDIVTDNMINDKVKYLEGDNELIKKYLGDKGNKYRLKNLKNKKEYFIKKARCIESPFIVLCDGWFYTEKRGAHQKK